MSSPRAARRSSAPSHFALRRKTRVALVAWLAAIAVVAALVWNRQRALAAHQVRLTEIEALRIEAQKQRDDSVSLLGRARELLATAAGQHAVPSASAPSPPAVQPPASELPRAEPSAAGPAAKTDK